MQYNVFGSDYVLRVDKGEEILDCIKTLCEKEHIFLADISGIGAVNHIQIGVFDTVTKEFLGRDMEGIFEITMLSGNVTKMDDQVYIHAHMSVADSKYHVYGGHLKSAVVSATAEIVIRCIDGSVGRKFDEDVGLNLLEF